MNGRLSNAKVIQGNGVFGKLSKVGLPAPFSPTIKALIRFIFMHCGYATHFEEFRDVNNKEKSIRTLIRALKQITRQKPLEEQNKEPLGAETASSEDENAIFVSSARGGKRSRDANDEFSVPAKRLCKG